MTTSHKFKDKDNNLIEVLTNVGARPRVIVNGVEWDRESEVYKKAIEQWLEL